jgi:hypothetical protein
LIRGFAVPKRGWLAVPALLLAGLPAFVLRFATEPPVAHTGGFGEPSCHTCHFDEPLNDPAGKIVVEGVPDRYLPGERYQLVVRLSRPGQARSGFQLSSRFASGPDAGAQAGGLHPPDDRVSISETVAGTQYASHNLAGTRPASDSVAEWRLEWTAPDDGGSVVFHVAGNAGNGDDSPFGDFIHTDSLVSTSRKPRS